jgi:hypothetical protein
MIYESWFVGAIGKVCVFRLFVFLTKLEFELENAS